MNDFRVPALAFSLVLILALTDCGGNAAVSPSISAPAAVGTATGARPASRRHKTTSTLTDWDSFGFDLQRSGYNPSESTVGVNNVGSLQKLWTVNVGYAMVHEPVLASGVYVNGQATNVLYAGSGNGSAMYAINASTGVALWKDPVPRTNYRCFHQRLLFSIGETPAIDRGKNALLRRRAQSGTCRGPRHGKGGLRLAGDDCGLHAQP